MDYFQSLPKVSLKWPQMTSADHLRSNIFYHVGLLLSGFDAPVYVKAGKSQKSVFFEKWAYIEY